MCALSSHDDDDERYDEWCRGVPEDVRILDVVSLPSLPTLGNLPSTRLHA